MERMLRGTGKSRSGLPPSRMGCPFSMLVLTLLMTVWVRVLRALNDCVVPRMLADDLLVYASSLDQDEDSIFQTFIGAVQCSVDFIMDMGARLSPKKCVLMTSCPSVRDRLRCFVFVMSIPLSLCDTP